MLNVLFALNMNYSFSLVIWGGFAIAGLFLYFPAHTKLTRLVGNEEQQGTIFGFTESFCGITNVIVNFIALGLFAYFSNKYFGVAGLKAAIIGYAVLGVIAVIFLAILVPDPGKSTSTGEENAINAKMGVKDWISIVTNPRTWLSGIAVFATYTMYCTLSYYTPYFSNVLGVSVVFTGGLSIFRQYGTRFIGAPVGGWLGDKIKSVSTVVGVSLAVAVIMVIAFMLMPASNSALIPIMVLMFALALVNVSMKGVQFSVIDEMGVDPKVNGMAIAVATLVGFNLPDVALHPIIGVILDKYEAVAAYKIVFGLLLGMLVLGFIVTMILMVMEKKAHKSPSPSKQS